MATGRPKAGYRLEDGTRVPGVTTITSRFKDSGGLIHWAWELGAEGKDYRKERDAAADTGTLVHAMIEHKIRGEDPFHALKDAREDQSTRAIKGFDAYCDWEQGAKVEILHHEVPLVSEAHRFGGTPDAIGTIGGRPALIDWKSSNGVYPEYLLQLAAYRSLWLECRGEKLDAVHLCRFGKEYGDFHHHSWPLEIVDMAWDAFLHMRALYDIDKVLRRVAR